MWLVFSVQHIGLSAATQLLNITFSFSMSMHILPLSSCLLHVYTHSIMFTIVLWVSVPLCAKWSMAKFQLEVLQPNPPLVLLSHKFATFKPQRNHFLCRPPVYICPAPTHSLSVLPQKLMDLAWWCMKASCRGGDKAIEGAGQNGGNGCIRRLTIEAGSAYADHARSYIHLSEVWALCNPTCISKQVEVCALQANSISKHLAGRGRAKCK